MTPLEPKSEVQEWLLIGFRGNSSARVYVINLCRQFGGRVFYRERDVMVVEAEGPTENINALLASLPRNGVTHLWRSGDLDRQQASPSPKKINFCGQ